MILIVYKQDEKPSIAENGAELANGTDYKTRQCYVKYVEYKRQVKML